MVPTVFCQEVFACSVHFSVNVGIPRAKALQLCGGGSLKKTLNGKLGLKRGVS